MSLLILNNIHINCLLKWLEQAVQHTFHCLSHRNSSYSVSLTQMMKPSVASVPMTTQVFQVQCVDLASSFKHSQSTEDIAMVVCVREQFCFFFQFSQVNLKDSTRLKRENFFQMRSDLIKFHQTSGNANFFFCRLWSDLVKGHTRTCLPSAVCVLRYEVGDIWWVGGSVLWPNKIKPLSFQQIRPFLFLSALIE